MKYVDFPGTGEKISVIGLGTWVFGGENWGGADDAACAGAVGEALDQGMNFIDTAPFYSDGRAESLIGQAIRGRRAKAFIATKCGLIRENGRVAHNLAPASVAREVDLSLSRLQCDVIDLYMCHWPDTATPVENTMDALLKLRAAGKIRHIGVSNFDVPLLKRACAIAPVATLEAPYSVLDRRIETDLVPFCREKGIGIIAYGAMGGGVLTGKYSREPNFTRRDARKMFYSFYEKEKFAHAQRVVHELRSCQHPLNQLALNWARQQRGVMTVLAGCRDALQARANAQASDWDISPEELAMIKGIKG
jgi:aryl-alcohol dehydrogenase-like predicted oxidoreductase